jgi:hypothetical protein
MMRLLNQLFGSNNQGKKKLNINKLLKAEDIGGSITKLDDYICNQCESGDHMDSLSDPQKIFYYIQCWGRDIKNGGFNQFYRNSSGDFAHETYDSLRIIGAYKIANIIMTANDQFPLKAVPKDRSERQKLLEQIQDTANEVWKELDQKFLANEEELNAVTMEFVRKNKDFF